ncbi:MAG TPA: cellulase family glycosylhydrolase, partial [Marmoricola sp.]|nr:cellulase family glycosylhydrolase [Marmoricola sp.]
MTRSLRSVVLWVLALLVAGLAALPANSADAESLVRHPSPSVVQRGSWLVDPSGRVIVLHGVNLVTKLAPYRPSDGGFGADDAAFLARNGFDAVRVGVLWAGVEPSPGRINYAYLAKVRSTVTTLAQHGIVALLDFHQDLTNERFGGEGWPAWAVNKTQPVVPAGFPFSYFVSPGEMATWDAFWANDPAPDGVGLQTHYVRAWERVAAYFKDMTAVMAYDLLNEPVPGTNFASCLLPIGCSD